MTAQALPAALPPASTPQQARELASGLIAQMTALIVVIDRETELVRAGNVRDAATLEKEKFAMSHGYLAAVARLKASRPALDAHAPDLLADLLRLHDRFRALLQVNLTVLATAHAVSEGIVRGVNMEIQKRNAPQTYSASGHRTAPPARHVTPLALSRSL
jgi:hypothetical protein